MKKTILCLLLALSLCFSLAMGAAAADKPLLCDAADLLSEAEEAVLLQKLESLSAEAKMDVVIVLVDSIGYQSPREYADDFYDYNGYGYGGHRDGLLLLVSLEESDWYISTCGEAITVFTDAGLDYMSDQFVPYLSSGDYAQACEAFITLCDEFIAQAATGDPYDFHNLPKEPFGFVLALVIALVIGFVIATIYTGMLKGQLKTVRRQAAAGHYIRNGSLHIHTSSDIFLYKTLSRTPRESNNKGSRIRTSSSGNSHGGRGGKF